MIEMKKLAEMVKDDYVGDCEVLEAGPSAARVRLSPETGESVTVLLTPVVCAMVSDPRFLVELVVVTPCGGPEGAGVIVTPAVRAVLAVALHGL